jgi:hypothetical protein
MFDLLNIFWQGNSMLNYLDIWCNNLNIELYYHWKFKKIKTYSFREIGASSSDNDGNSWQVGFLGGNFVNCTSYVWERFEFWIIFIVVWFYPHLGQWHEPH